MRKYVVMLKMALMESAAYRWNLVFEVLAQMTVSFFIVLVWKHVSGGAGVGGFSEQELLTYLLLSGFVLSSVHVTSSGDYMNDQILEGALSFRIIKPWSTLVSYFMESLAPRTTMFLTSAAGYGLLGLAFGLKLEGVTAKGVLLALPLFLLAVLLQHVLFYSISFLAFWLNQTWGPRLIARVIMEIGAGVIIPISLIHPAVRGAFELLPFRFFGDAPAIALLGRTDTGEYAFLLALGIGWLFALWGVYLFVWKRGTKSYEAVGN